MSNNLKITLIKLFSLLKFLGLLSSLYFLLGCALFASEPDIKPPTARELLYDKGRELLLVGQYKSAEQPFLTLVAEPESNSDFIYDNSLWSLSLVYEKLDYPEKSIVTLNQLLARKSKHVSRFKTLASLMKNYFRVGNSDEAQKFKKMLDIENPKSNIEADQIYLELQQTMNLNFDHSLLEELEYLSEVQKYLLFVMEQNQSKSNVLATNLLISIYQQAYSLTEKDVMNKKFKEKVLIALFDNINRFNIYKINDLNVNMQTVAKFSNFSEKLQKQITERLYQ